MKNLIRLLKSGASKAKNYMSQKLKTISKRKNLLKFLRRAFFTVLCSIVVALCAPLNSGIALSLLVIWTTTKYNLFLLLAIVTILIPLSIYDWVSKQ